MKVWPINVRNTARNNAKPAGGLGVGEENAPHFTLIADGNHPPSVAMVEDKREMDEPKFTVRRITPVEAERLQGFPDGYTDIEYNGRPAPDTLRYKALGNSMTVNVMRWLAERILEADKNGD
jgi:site-specific DNA-cytosine methylase